MKFEWEDIFNTFSPLQFSITENKFYNSFFLPDTVVCSLISKEDSLFSAVPPTGGDAVRSALLNIFSVMYTHSPSPAIPGTQGRSLHPRPE